MTLEAAIYSLLAADAPVGAIAGDRISPSSRLQGSALPAVVYQVQTIEPVRGLAGSAGLSLGTFDATAIAETYAAAKSLAEAVIAALDGATGTHGSIVIQAMRYQTQTAADSMPGEGDEDTPAEITATFATHYEGT